MLCKSFLFISIIFISQHVEGAKILGIFPVPSYSHFVLGETSMKELARRGHEVTVVSPYPQKTKIPNYTDYPVTEMVDVLMEMKKRFYDREKMNVFEQIQFLHNMAYHVNEGLLKLESFQKLINSEQKFDIIVLEYFMNEASMSLAKKFGVPLVLSSTLPPTAVSGHVLGNPIMPSFLPYILTDFSPSMTFKQRFLNLFYNLYDYYYKEYHMIPLHQKLIQDYVDKNIKIEDVRHNVSVFLLNAYPTVSQPMPLLPNMIEVGGYHITEGKALPQDLKKLLDEAKDGVVLFSMGSNLKSADLSPALLEEILNSFQNLKQTVLWKFEAENLKNIPKNVHISNWIPQREVLNHTNTKAFISHGGFLSTMESVHFGVPIIGIPVFGDQKMNIAVGTEKGYAVTLPFKQLSGKTLSNALDEILNNPKYYENAQRYSSLMRNRQAKPLDTVIFWIEHILKYKNADHLKTSSLNLNWYQLYMLDVVLGLILLVTVPITLIFTTFKMLRNKPKNQKIKTN